VAKSDPPNPNFDVLPDLDQPSSGIPQDWSDAWDEADIAEHEERERLEAEQLAAAGYTDRVLDLAESLPRRFPDGLTRLETFILCARFALTDSERTSLIFLLEMDSTNV